MMCHRLGPKSDNKSLAVSDLRKEITVISLSTVKCAIWRDICSRSLKQSFISVTEYGKENPSWLAADSMCISLFRVIPDSGVAAFSNRNNRDKGELREKQEVKHEKPSHTPYIS